MKNMNQSGELLGDSQHLFLGNITSLGHRESNGSFWKSVIFMEDVLFSGHEPGTIVLVVMYSLSFLTGIVGNIMALRVLTRKRRSRLAGVSATRSLLINLAVCDMMVVCFCMPITLGQQVYNAWVFGDWLCRAVPFVQAVSVSASVLSLAVISINRYYSVHNPLNARSFFTCGRVCTMIVVVWAFSSGLCAPLAFMNRTKNLVLFEGQLVILVCTESWPHAKLRQAYNFLLFCTLYGLPVIFNLIICFLTGRRLWSTDDKLHECHQGNFPTAAARLRGRKKIAKMVVALVLLFTLSWLPLYVVDIWIDFNLPSTPASAEQDPAPMQYAWVLNVRPFAQWLGLTNSALNPLCYCFVGNLYRSARKFKDSYRKRVSSVFSLSLSQTSSHSSIPRLLSYRASTDLSDSELRGWRNCTKFNQLLSKSKSMSSVTICETSLD